MPVGRPLDQLVEVRHAVRVDPQAAADRPGQGDRGHRGHRAMPEPERSAHLAHPHEGKRKRRQHVAEVVAEAGLGADQHEDGAQRGQQGKLVAPWCRVPAAPRCHGKGQEEEHPGTRRLLDRRRIKVVVPPASVPPLAPEVGPHLLLEILPLNVDPHDVVLGQRHGEPAEPGFPEAVARVEVGSRRGGRSAQGLADELVVLQLLEGAFKGVADVDRVHRQAQDGGQVGHLLESSGRARRLAGPRRGDGFGRRRLVAARAAPSAEQARQSPREPQSGQKGKQHDPRHLGQLGQAQDHAGNQRAPPRGPPEPAPERIHGGHAQGGGRHLRQHQLPVVEDARRETPQRQGHHPGGLSIQPARPAIADQRPQQAQGNARPAGRHDVVVPAVGIHLDEAGSQRDLAAHPGRRRVAAPIDVRPGGQDGQGGEAPGKRRVNGVDAEPAEMPVAEARGQVRRLDRRDAVLLRAPGERRDVGAEQNRHPPPNPSHLLSAHEIPATPGPKSANRENHVSSPRGPPRDGPQTAPQSKGARNPPASGALTTRGFGAGSCSPVIW